MRVELLWWRGCPSWPQARALLREEMEQAGLDPDTVIEHELLADEEAEQERFYGSPTIRVDGRDVATSGTNPIGLTCRVYRLRDGRISALPDRADIADALRAATEGGGEA